MVETHACALSESARDHRLHTRFCDGCGTAMLRDERAASWLVRWGDVVFCDDCARAASTEEIERTRSQIALRGVPMS